MLLPMLISIFKKLKLFNKVYQITLIFYTVGY